MFRQGIHRCMRLYSPSLELSKGILNRNGAAYIRTCYSSQKRLAATSVSNADTLKKPDMFCYQCEQTKSRRGCVTVGVCGKSAQVAALQDLLMYVIKGLAVHANRAINMGIYSSEACDTFVKKAMFSTLTNVNFDQDRFPEYIRQAVEYRDEFRAPLIAAYTKRGEPLCEALTQGPAVWKPEKGYDDMEYLENEGHKVGVLEDQQIYGPDINGVRYMTLYGIKGLSAYACHAEALGENDPWVSKFIYRALDFLVSAKKAERFDLGLNLQMALDVGATNLRVMELLDKGHRRILGTPTPTDVCTTPKEGKCILVSGHDLVDLHTLLKSTEGTGINVYTHGEMMPAHMYPKLNAFKSLAGHFGGAWQNQKIDFATFPGPVLASTNCVIEPLRSYRDRLYTLNDTGIHGVRHLDLHNPTQMKQLLEHANSLSGFDSKTAKKYDDRHLVVGFGREVIAQHADTVINAVKSGDLQRICVIGGCDGSEHKRNYFTNLAKSLPSQTLILTMGCAKYRLNTINFGTLGNTGIPRLLDMGQCNDSYGAIMVAKTLADILDTDINSLPLSISLSWFEQKAVAVLLSLLSLGVKNIKLGPIMPAFLTPGVREALDEKFGIVPVDIRHPDEDMDDMFHN
ncbi:hydroxylamine reductase-like [Mercenaria mercenaria]|uniref:hydroxylamine reductase-like n=1 Tax=Mercenaria mercenaria TaxID=6596 RepID=UPI00234F766D|nr:hydroxylamine reductase-like [Mercenaria mercenaria]